MGVFGGRVRHTALAHGRVWPFRGQMDLDRAIADYVESNTPAPAQGAVPANSRPISSTAQQPLPPPVPQQVPVVPQVIVPIRLRLSNTVARGRPSRNMGNVSGGRGVTRDTAARYDVRAPVGAYAILARKEVSSPDVITITFTLYDTKVIALIDSGSTHSYIVKASWNSGTVRSIVTLSNIC
ncbi:Phosphoribosylamine--glycine ligase [Gossypium arboreum]|uniref:Phosphoribosylamine--glycine ligase n=1 Tax=Gossypium arboreum TaxID=29729 RepID=A0A0B0P4R8_GOSAR|nr:Phosphoribosylamine--glycine ligase [Gossypium arboreum]